MHYINITIIYPFTEISDLALLAEAPAGQLKGHYWDTTLRHRRNSLHFSFLGTFVSSAW